MQWTRFRGIVISLTHVLGLAVTYSMLAVVASLSGKVFGQFQKRSGITAVGELIWSDLSSVG